MIEGLLFLSEAAAFLRSGRLLRIKSSTCRFVGVRRIVVLEVPIRLHFWTIQYSSRRSFMPGREANAAVSLEVIVIASRPPLCFGKDRMNIARSIRSESKIPQENSCGNIWDFLRSITADPLEREIGSNRENEFRRVVATAATATAAATLQPHDFV